MKRIIPFALALMMVLTACTPKTTGTTKTPDELRTHYTQSINAARDAETAESIPVITSKEDMHADMIIPLLGVAEEDMTAFAIALSAMNVQAYGIAAIMPAAGKTEAVIEALKGYVEKQQANFNNYLMEQYEIATATKIETLSDGTVLLVMSQGQDALFTAIKDAIEKA